MSVSQVQEIREEIDNYIENSQVRIRTLVSSKYEQSTYFQPHCQIFLHQEPGFYENEYIYDDIEGLEEMLLDVRINTDCVWKA